MKTLAPPAFMIIFPNRLASAAALTRIVLALTLLLSVTFSLSANPLVYQGSYNPGGNTNDRFAPNLTTGGNTTADPVWQWNQSNDPPAPTIRQTNGVWVLSSSTTDAQLSSWGIGQGQFNTNAWRATNAIGSTIDLNLRVEDGLFTMRAGNQSHYIDLNVQKSGTNSRVWLGTGPFASLDVTNFNSIRVAMQNGFASLYVNDIENPLNTNISMIANINFNQLVFGDRSTGANTRVTYDLANISWSNAEAVFAAPVPEPTTALYLGLTAAFVLATRRFLKRSRVLPDVRAVTSKP